MDPAGYRGSEVTYLSRWNRAMLPLPSRCLPEDDLRVVHRQDGIFARGPSCVYVQTTPDPGGPHEGSIASRKLFPSPFPPFRHRRDALLATYPMSAACQQSMPSWSRGTSGGADIPIAAFEMMPEGACFGFERGAGMADGVFSTTSLDALVVGMPEEVR